MPSRPFSVRSLLAVSLTLAAAVSSIRVAPAQPPVRGLYDPNPAHLWNRVHDLFHVRAAPDGSRHGADTVDPLLWRETNYLLAGPSHARAVGVLDEFLASRGERLVRSPIKRAVFQHDLWAVFDWLAGTSEGDRAARAALERRLARVIRRVALSRKDIDALPDTYAAAVASGAFVSRDPDSPRPVFPRDLYSATGPWVVVGGLGPIVPHHAAELSRSAFTVLWNLPGGAAETRAYLKKLWDHPQPFVPDETFAFARDGEVRSRPNPALPAVPDRTQIALVRKMLLVDDEGAIVPSNVVQSIQLRGFPGRQSFSEFRLSRAALFAGQSGGLQPVGAGERDFITFSAKGMDVFEGDSRARPMVLPKVLDGCINCHHVGTEPAVETIQSLRSIVRPAALVDSRHERWARWFNQGVVAAGAKGRTYEWGVLQGLWEMERR